MDDTENQTIAWLFLTLLAVSVTAGTVLMWWVSRWLQQRKEAADRWRMPGGSNSASLALAARLGLVERPGHWLAIRCLDPGLVQAALQLHNPRPCPWPEDLASMSFNRLFVSPPIRGWVLVMGPSLPDPGDDPDACFHFLRQVSEQLGHVQFFSVNRLFGHHAWVRAEQGEIIRAYAWAGETLWNQGEMTRDELELQMHCGAYTESGGSNPGQGSDLAQANCEKASLLAARWSLDPAMLQPSPRFSLSGVVGEVPQARLR